ncbi:MAG: methyltransferase [Crocinitomicaceae bacterium]|nr:methyltransferase [Crocinitomicaceae bacterium]
MRVGTDAVLLGAWADVGSAKRILDVGTGTGVIALICAQRNTFAVIDAVEIDPGSSEDARYNFSHSPWSERLKLHEGNFLKITVEVKFDFIISNPPYFSQSLRATNPVRSTARHDDTLPAELFMHQAATLLTKDGIIALIIPRQQLKRWLDRGLDCGFFPRRICHVFTLAHKDSTRVMLEFIQGYPGEPVMESLLIEKSPGEFSESYKLLTHEFYTKW